MSAPIQPLTRIPRMVRRRTGVREGRLWDVGVWVVLTAVTLAALIPLWYVVAISVTPLDVWSRTNGSLFVPLDKMTLVAYRQLFDTNQVVHALGVSLYITVVGTALSLAVTTLMAYPLAQRRFPLRRPILLAVLFTMLFNGGLIPTYLIVRDLGLLNTYWALMLPNLVSPFNLLVMKTFFQNLPEDLLAAARIDGASEWRVLTRIVLPLSKPILATIALFYAVVQWNSYFDAVLYINDPSMQPLQVVLRTILTSGTVTDFTDINQAHTAPLQSLQMAAVVVTTIPILLVYPFLQRYFSSGVLLGSIKD